MVRYLLCLLLIAAGMVATSCGGRVHLKPLQRGPNGEGAGDNPVASGPKDSRVGCYVMTISPAFEKLIGEYVDAGTVCRVFRTKGPDTAPMYDFANNSTGDHLYAVWPAELDRARSGGYDSEHIACYVHTTPSPGRLPLYRLFKHGTWCRFYTIDEATRDSLITLEGYSDEGFACYVPADTVGGTVPLYRMRGRPSE